MSNTARSLNLAAQPSPAPTNLTPFHELLAGFTADLATMRRLDPNSGACTTLADVRARLEHAIEEASADSLWLSVKEAASREGVTEAAITHRCRNNTIRSRKVGGRYLIDPNALRAA